MKAGRHHSRGYHAGLVLGLAVATCAGAGAGCKKASARADGDGSSSAGNAPDPAALSVRFIRAANGYSVGVEMTLTGAPVAKVKALRATRGWGGTAPLKAISHVEVSDAGGAISVGDPVDDGGFSLMRLGRAPMGTLVVRYKARVNDGASRFELHGGPAGLSAAGHGFLLRPATDEAVPITVRFSSENAAWRGTFASSAEGLSRGTVEDLAAAVYTFGDIRVESAQRGEQAVMAFGARLDGKAALGLMGRTAEYAKKFWGVADSTKAGEKSLFVIGETGAGEQHDGALLGSALAIWIDRERALDDGVKVLIAHEALHRVFGDALRVDANGRDAAWFSEGFATFYARKVLFDEGLLGAEGFAADVNRARGNEADSGARDGGAHAVGYTLGERYAALLDVATRARSKGTHSLNDIVKALAVEAGQMGGPVKVARFREIAAAEVGEEKERALWDGLIVGALGEVPSDAYGPCFTRKTKTTIVPMLGFDAASLRDKPLMIRGTVPGSNAEKAGVHDGALVLKSSVKNEANVDPDQAVELVLAGAKGKRVVRYKPFKKESVTRFEPVACTK
ncbi:MAG: hypothetical protein IPK82_22630 [Polyangiaceae bacterium]|nr:hypothetical protein [Polyangiaceae bacterium]